MSVVPITNAVVAPAWSAPRVADHRLVAVTVSTQELLRPDSDLARVLAFYPRADLLLVTDEPRLRPVRIVPPPMDVDDLPPIELDQHAVEPDEPRVAVADLGLPGLEVSRLDLSTPLTGHAEDDVVAALSELIGFDPEPGVVCLAPTPEDADSAVVSRAAQRVAQVYGLPLLRFQCHGLSAAGVTGA
jgi:hypothetical protein